MAYEAPNRRGTADKPKKKITLKRVLLIIGIIVILVLTGVSTYISSLLHALTVQPVLINGKANLFASVVSQDLLFNNFSRPVPYALLSYTWKNLSRMSVNASIYGVAVPRRIYLLNATNECSGCINMNQFLTSLDSDLANYSITSSEGGVTLISPSQLISDQVSPNSILIVPNGHLPFFMLTNNTLIKLLNSGTSIIYVGQNFSRLVEAEGVLVPDTTMPPFLTTTAVGYTSSNSYIFNQSTFSFTGGSSLGPLTYIEADNGFVVAFPNFMDSWKTPQGAASDISKAIFQEFWLPQIAYGTGFVNQLGNESKIGIILNKSSSSYFNYTENRTTAYVQEMANLNNGYARVVLEGFQNATSTAPDKYYVFYYKPEFSTLGYMQMPGTAIPGSPITGSFMITINGTNKTVEPHLDIFDLNHTLLESMPPIFSKSLSSNYTFFDTFTLSLPAGPYIAQLDGFGNQHYSSALFVSPTVTFTLLGGNVSQGYYVFSAYAGPIPLNNETAKIKVNGQYSTTVQINNGEFVYKLPSGITTPTGVLTFDFEAFSQQFSYRTNFTPPTYSINKQYIYFLIAVVVVILEITLVKAPQRDDFFIDVPNMPEPKKTSIKLKANEMLNVFDRQSLYYHWHFMPLTDSEFKYGVANNVKWQNLPVVLTFNNADAILDGMVSKGDVVSADGFYAPKTWEQLSKHDIEYLVTFRKLRNYLTSHGQQFSDMDISTESDLTTVLNGEKALIVIYSKTSSFTKNIPIRPPIKTYVAFINGDALEDFKTKLYSSTSIPSEELKMYIASGNVILLDADNPENFAAA